jgi:hypothetical protein
VSDYKEIYKAFLAIRHEFMRLNLEMPKVVVSDSTYVRLLTALDRDMNYVLTEGEVDKLKLFGMEIERQ